MPLGSFIGIAYRESGTGEGVPSIRKVWGNVLAACLLKPALLAVLGITVYLLFQWLPWNQAVRSMGKDLAVAGWLWDSKQVV